MKLGTKLGLGFGLLIVITCLLGGLAVYNMKNVASESTTLAHEYVPEVEVGAELRGAVNRTMYQMRGYSYSENEELYNKAQAELAATKAALDKGRELSKTAHNLKKLAGQIESASSAVEKYGQLAAETNKTITGMAGSRKVLDESAQAYMTDCAAFLEGQNKAMKTDLYERLTKIRLVNNITAIGTKARVLNFKSQALADSEMMTRAISELDKLDSVVAELRPITKATVNIKQIDDTVASARAYQNAMRAFLVEFRKGDNANDDVLAKHRETMDKTAATYVGNCDAFMASQYVALEKDMMERLRKITLANDVIDSGNAARIATFKSQALRNPELLVEGQKQFDVIGAKCDDLRKITRLEADRKLIDETEENGSHYEAAMQSFLKEWLALQELGKQRDQTGKEMIEASKTMADAAIAGTTNIAQSAVSSLTTSTTVMTIGVIVAVLVGIVLAIAITRSITKPINRVIANLTTGAEQTTSAAGQVSAASQSLAQGSSEQAASLEETTASMEEMSSMTNQNADNANEAKKLAETAWSSAEKGTEAMTRMSSAIDDIKTSSDETAKIIKTIDEIAFQTNLLALNAAVEAARAGEAGKGFAVVAEEVRNLAQRSAEAARTTADMIEGSVKNADNGVAISKEVAESLGEIAEGSRKVNDLVGEIAAASNEQSQGIDQISTAVTQMDQVTQSNAANAEESASASEELSAQAEELNRMVQDLQAIVGGRSGVGSTNATSATTEHKHLNLEVKHLTDHTKTVRPATSTAVGKTTSTNPEEFIPMGAEEELASF